MPYEKLDTELRQEQILQAALELISAQGMKGLSMVAVARRIGVVPSAIYRHFASKDAIVTGMLQLIERRLMGNVAAVREERQRPLAALEALLLRHVRLIRENAGIPRVVFSEEVYGGHPQRKEHVHRVIQRYLGAVAGMFREGQDEGIVRQDIRPEDLAVMFLGLVQPAAILWHLSDGGFDVTKHVQRSWRVFREAVAAPAGDNGRKSEERGVP
jgi:AcrR family transcriptional regulator